MHNFPDDNRASVKPNKHLGQHFLVDKQVINRLIDSAELRADDAVLEIGPGTGVLTRLLAGRSRLVAAVEKDPRMAEILRRSVGKSDNVTLLVDDIFNVDLNALSRISSEFKIVASIPYNISTKLLIYLTGPLIAQGPLRIREMVLLVQKEVALKLTAAPGTKGYGILTVTAGLRTDTEVLFDVPPESFHPRPAVMSSVIRTRVSDAHRYTLVDENAFNVIVRAAFEQRRKTISNALYGARYFKCEKAEIVKVLNNCGIDTGTRGEDLSILQFVGLANSFSNLKLTK